MSRKRCRHENADHLMLGELFTLDGDPNADVIVTKCEQFRCVDCGAWLSLGPSNDEPESVRVEIRAARLHAGYMTANDCDNIVDDPITSNCIGYMLGENDLSPEAREVFELSEVMRLHEESDHDRALAEGE